ncbi:MAG: GAF domain-containing protein, partial [Actinomycetota bacterium]
MKTERNVVARICALAIVLAGAAGVAFALLPNTSTSLRPSGWWMLPLLAVGYAVAERSVFHFEFRHEAITFSISEVPTVFALVYLAPGPAVVARLVGSLAIIAFQWRSPLYKLFFNAALFSLELAISYHIMGFAIRQWGSSNTAVLFSLVLATAGAVIIGSVMVACAISMVEGGFIDRVKAELSLTCWVAPLDATAAAAMVAPTMLSPWLVLLAMVPLIAFWAVMRGYGSLEQRFRDLDDLHGFVRKVGPSLELDELATTAATESASRLRARRSSMVIFDDAAGHHRSDVGDPLPQLPERADDEHWVSVLTDSSARQLDGDTMRSLGLNGLADVGDVLVAPITDGNTVLGLLVLAERNGADDTFRKADVARLATMADQLAPTLRKAMFHERIEHEARHDALTALPNRTSFERLVDTAIAHRPSNTIGEGAGVVEIDPDYE